MSLTQFVQRPAIKNAFNTYATKERTPRCLRRQPILVRSTSRLPDLVGNALDYLARFHLARKLRDAPIEVYQRERVAELGITRLGMMAYASPDFVSDQDRGYWRQAFDEAQSEVENYVNGASDIQRAAVAVQVFGHLDFMYRNPRRFDANFRPQAEISNELVSLLELFDPLARLAPQRHCLLNPAFAASAKVGGADADLVIDDRLIDFKVTVKPSVTVDHMLQLAGYAALHRLGGIVYPEYEHKDSFHTVELYFARQGVLVQWPIDELFPDGGFDSFCEIFEAEVVALASETEEYRC